MSATPKTSPRFPTVEEWAAHRYKLGQLVPEGHPGYESWMKDFE